MKKYKEDSENFWRGVPGVHMVWHGEYSDPELEYEGKRVNYRDIEDSMYEYYKEQKEEGEGDYTFDGSDEDFDKFCQDHADSIYGDFDDFSGTQECFACGSWDYASSPGYDDCHHATPEEADALGVAEYDPICEDCYKKAQDILGSEEDQSSFFKCVFMNFRVGDKVTFDGYSLWEMADETNDDYIRKTEYSYIRNEDGEYYDMQGSESNYALGDGESCEIVKVTDRNIDIKSDSSDYDNDIVTLTWEEARECLTKEDSFNECETSGNFTGSTPDHMIGSPVMLGLKNKSIGSNIFNDDLIQEKHDLESFKHFTKKMNESTGDWTGDRFVDHVLDAWLEYVTDEDLTYMLKDSDFQKLIDLGILDFADFVLKEFPACKDYGRCNYDVKWSWENFGLESNKTKKIKKDVDEYLKQIVKGSFAVTENIDYNMVSDAYDPDELESWLSKFNITKAERDFIHTIFEDGNAEKQGYGAHSSTEEIKGAGLTEESAIQDAKNTAKGNIPFKPFVVAFSDGSFPDFIDGVYIVYTGESISGFLGGKEVAPKRKPTDKKSVTWTSRNTVR